MSSTREALVDNIKNEIIADLLHTRDNSFNTRSGNRPSQFYGPHERALADAIKRDVLAEIEAQHEQATNMQNAGNVQNRPGIRHHDRALADAIKQDVLAGIEAQQKQMENMQNCDEHTRNIHEHRDRALAEAIKRDILAELGIRQRSMESAPGYRWHEQRRYGLSPEECALADALKREVLLELGYQARRTN